ncbi:MAG TPA: hypothetical protein VM008_14280 [Phycisphaerae bacterium]|nr:hypothetical protein [Phycisphaerae bacterium]
MGKKRVAFFTAVAVLVGILPALCAPTGTMPAAKVRVGTYNTRMVALAYWRSAEGMKVIGATVNDAMAAKKAGEKEKAAELEKKAKDLQRRLHNEVFGNSPIPEVTEAMKSALNEVAQAKDVVAIVPEVAYAGDSVDVVDVTEEIVAKCKPTEQTRRVLNELPKHPPAEMEVIGAD